MADSVEESLRRYRPSGPHPELRRRIVQQPAGARTWPWAAAAAALFVMTVVLHGQVDSQVQALYDPPADPRREAIEQLTTMLGGTEEARIVAETIALQEQVRATRTATPPAPEAR